MYIATYVCMLTFVCMIYSHITILVKNFEGRIFADATKFSIFTILCIFEDHCPDFMQAEMNFNE